MHQEIRSLPVLPTQILCPNSRQSYCTEEMSANYQIEWLEPAKDDLRDIVFYLINKVPVLALSVQEAIESQLTVLETFPHISQRNAYFDDVFDFKIKGLPYLVVYKIFPATLKIEILAVMHDRRDRSNPKNYRL